MKLAVDNTRAPAGWRIDGDGWFVRCMNPGEPEIKGAEHVGFTFDGVVYVREVRHCHDYDRGIVTPSRRARS